MINKKITAAITAVGGYVPEFRLTNKMLEEMVDTNDEWIVSRTGIKERRILKGEGLGTSDMATQAVKLLCEKRGISPMEIDLIICATTTPDFVFPATANIISDKVGAKNAWGFDLQAACKSNPQAFFAPTLSEMILAVAGKTKSGVVVAQIIRSISIGLIPRFSQSNFTACVAISEVPNPSPFSILLSLMPVRDTIHSSLVSTISSSILFVRRNSGTYPPTAVM